MHMQNPILPKVIPQVLPHSHHAQQLPSIDHICIGKSPLRPIHAHRSAAKRSKMPFRPPMNLISLWHRPSQKTENNGDGTGPTRTTVATVRKSIYSTAEKLVPDLLCFNRFN
jgi:hypothetical protein